MTTTITLRPIGYGWNPSADEAPMETWDCQPDHVASLLRGEYRWLRLQGVSELVARWHVHRMLAMLNQPAGWWARYHPEPTTEDDWDDDWPDDDDEWEGGGHSTPGDR